MTTTILSDNRTTFVYDIDENGNKVGMLFDKTGNLLNVTGEAAPVIEDSLFRIGDKVKTKSPECDWVFDYKIIRGTVINIFQKESNKNQCTARRHQNCIRTTIHQICVVSTKDGNREIYQNFLEIDNDNNNDNNVVLLVSSKKGFRTAAKCYIEKIIKRLSLPIFKKDVIVYDSYKHKFSQIRCITKTGYIVSSTGFYNDAKTTILEDSVSFKYAYNNFRKFKDISEYGVRDHRTGSWRVKTII